MIRVGEPPYLECSSRGDKRFSAWYAKPKVLGGLSIEEAYHALKIFDDGSTGQTWREAKLAQGLGHKIVNLEYCHKAYSLMWDEYIRENPELLDVLKAAPGLSDMFGQEGHACQAVELWRIRNGGASSTD